MCCKIDHEILIHKGHDCLPFRLCPFSYAQWL
nr:MAG TPA: carboxypeptidase inhibitor [Caudoviricetes sp.]